MKILLTGAFGNLGANTLECLLKTHMHDILCFDVKNKPNLEKSRTLAAAGPFDICWGDICDVETINKAVKTAECILHLAAIIPPLSETKPDLVNKVNIEGTHNLISAAEKMSRKPKFIFTSSVSVHGRRHSVPPPRKAGEPTQATDHYTRSKIHSEKELAQSALPWTILRVGAAAPVTVTMADMDGMATMFDVPLDQRLECIHPRDVATAITNAVMADTTGKILYLGGGEKCRMINREFLRGMFETLGIGMLPESAFKKPKTDEDYWYTDFVDTEESQRLLKFQHTDFDDYLKEVRKNFGWKRGFARILSPVIRAILVRRSPYYKTK